MAGAAAVDLRAKSHDRNVFAGVVGALVGGIVAVIGGEDDQVAGPEQGDELGQAAVEFFQAIRIAGGVAAMAVKLVEVDEIGEDEVAVPGLADRLERGVELALVVGRLQDARDAAAGKDVGDLADAEDVAAARLGDIEEGLARRRHGKILAMTRAPEVFAGLAEEGTSDHAADVEGVAELSGDAADL